MCIHFFFNIVSCIPADKLKKKTAMSIKLYTILSQTSTKFSPTIHFSHCLNRLFEVLYKTKTLYNRPFAATSSF